MSRRRAFSAAVVTEIIDQVVKTGVSTTIKSGDVVIEIRPPERSKATNPADLVDMSE